MMEVMIVAGATKRRAREATDDGQSTRAHSPASSFCAESSCRRAKRAGQWWREQWRFAHPSPGENCERPAARACLRACCRSTREWQMMQAVFWRLAWWMAATEEGWNPGVGLPSPRYHQKRDWARRSRTAGPSHSSISSSASSCCEKCHSATRMSRCSTQWRWLPSWLASFAGSNRKVVAERASSTTEVWEELEVATAADSN